MKQFKPIVLLILLGIISACSVNPPVPFSANNGMSCTAMPEGRTAAAAFAIGNYIYVFAGRDSAGNNTSTLFRYDTATDSWDSFATPLSPRVNATAIAAGNVAYLGLGYDGKIYTDSSYLKDWWLFDPSSHTFTQMSAYPNTMTVGCTVYLQEDTIYCLYGFGKSFSKDNNKYAIQSDTWTESPVTATSPPMRFGGVGCIQNGQAYFGGGFCVTTFDDWYGVNLQTSTYVPAGKLTHPVVNAAMAATNDSIYLFGGRYWGGNMTGGQVYNAEGQVAVTVNNTVYYGLGESADNQVLCTWYKIAN